MKTLISNLLNSKSLTFDINKIALTYTEGDTYYGISYNYMGTGLHIPVDQVNAIGYRCLVMAAKTILLNLL